MISGQEQPQTNGNSKDNLRDNPFVQNYRSLKFAYDPQLIIEEGDRNAAARYFTCPICLGIIRDGCALTCDEGHLFCKACILSYWQSEPNHDKTCPCDREGNLSITNINRYIQKSIDALRVQCPFSNTTLILANDYVPILTLSKSFNSNPMGIKTNIIEDVIKPVNDEIKQIHNDELQKQKSISPAPSTTTDEGQQDRDEGSIQEGVNQSKMKEMLAEFVKNMQLCQWKGMLKDLEQHIYGVIPCDGTHITPNSSLHHMEAFPPPPSSSLSNDKDLVSISATPGHQITPNGSQNTISPKQHSCTFSCSHCSVSHLPSLDWLGHFQNCPKFPVYCPYQCEKGRICREKLSDHMTNECENRLVRCTNRECQEMICYKDIKHHIAQECKYRHIDCPFRKYGCTVGMITAFTMKTHLTDFAYQHITYKMDYLEKELLAEKSKNLLLSQQLSILQSKSMEDEHAPMRSHSVTDWNHINTHHKIHNNNNNNNNNYRYQCHHPRFGLVIGTYENKNPSLNRVEILSLARTEDMDHISSKDHRSMDSKYFDLKGSAIIYTDKIEYDLIDKYITKEFMPNYFDNGESNANTISRDDERSVTLSVIERRRPSNHTNSLDQPKHRASRKAKSGDFGSVQPMDAWSKLVYGTQRQTSPSGPNHENISDKGCGLLIRVGGISASEEMGWDPKSLYRCDGLALFNTRGTSTDTKRKCEYFVLPELSTNRCYAQAIFYEKKNSIIVAGGWNSATKTKLSSLEELTFNTDTNASLNWKSTYPRMLQKRAHLSLCLVDQQYLFALGGDERENAVSEYLNLEGVHDLGTPGENKTEDIESKDDISILRKHNNNTTTNTKAWKSIAAFNNGYDRCQCGTLYDPYKNRLILAGGFSERNESNSSQYSLVEEYDIHKNTWYKLPDLSLGDGSILPYEYYPKLFLQPDPYKNTEWNLKKETSLCSCNVCNQLAHYTIFIVGCSIYHHDKIACEYFDRRDSRNKWNTLELPHMRPYFHDHQKWNPGQQFRSLFQI